MTPTGVAGADVFALTCGGVVLTPPARGIVPGVLRGWLLSGGAADDVAGVREAHLTVGDLLAARAVFLSTSGRGVVPVTHLDGRALARDPLTERLHARWRALPMRAPG